MPPLTGQIWEDGFRGSRKEFSIGIGVYPFGIAVVVAVVACLRSIGADCRQQNTQNTITAIEIITNPEAVKIKGVRGKSSNFSDA
uniref:Uncharacterized protein n=1 Tax=Panagrolaimus sp. ES5 TaxID=591445 RepID=A0AC34G3F2_9BILA